MSGSRHHIIPQFLLKGFTFRKPKGKQYYSWIYEKERDSFNTNIINLCVEKDFYGRVSEEISADEEITRLENDYAPFIENLRREESTIKIPSDLSSSFVIHLVTRNKFIRHEFSSCTNYMLESLSSYLNDQNVIARLVLGKLQNSPEEFMEPAQLEVEKNLGRKINFEEKLILYSGIQQILPQLLKQEVPNIKSKLVSTVSDLKRDLSRITKHNHNKILSQNSPNKMSLYLTEKFNWQLTVYPQPSLILGDTGVLFRKRQDYMPFPNGLDEIEEIFLPISERHLIVGTKNKKKLAKIKANPLNENIANCSYKFFMSSQQKHSLQKLAKLIGTKANLLGKLEMDDIASQVVTESSLFW